MLQVRWQEPDICDEVPEMPQRPDEAEEQDAGRQEVRLSLLLHFETFVALADFSLFCFASASSKYSIGVLMI
jgi:hypothetical protein